MPERDELKVVAHLADGSLVKGVLRNSESFDPLSAGLIGQTLPSVVALDTGGGRQVIELQNTKALFFVKTLEGRDRKSTRLNSSHRCISYAVFCLKKKKNTNSLNI